MPPERYEVHADIRVAETLPGSFYTDAAAHARLVERVFAPSWQFIPGVERLGPEPGVVPFTLLEGWLDEPLVLTRDERGFVRCLSNVCTHRAKIVATEARSVRALVCGYHGRRFDLDGSFRSMPEFEGALHFPRACDDLVCLPLERLGPLHFTSIAPRAGFSETFGDLFGRLAWLPHDRLVLDPSRSRTFEFDANWALYCDNFLEGFHIPFIHPTLSPTIEFSSYATELFCASSVQIGEAKPGEPALEPPRGTHDHGRRIAGYFSWLFPNLMLNYYPWGLSLNLVEPLSVARTRVRFQAWVWDASKLGRGAGGDLHAVELEDEAIVTSAQQGVRSRLYRRGRYSPARETGVHHFHRMLAAALA